MRVLNALLPLAGLLALSETALAKDIDKCTQVTRNFVTNGDFTTDSDWTTSVTDATIVTPEESGGSGYIEIPFTAGETFTIQTPVSGIQSGPTYQLNVDWNLIADTEAQATCEMEILAITDTSSQYITYAVDYTDETTGFQTVLGQWFSDSSDIQLQFSVTCYDGSGTLQLAAASFLGPEMVCTSQCAASTTTLSGNLIQDGDFTHFDEDDDVWTTYYPGSTADDGAPGGGQCFVITKDWSDFYQLNQTISDAQVGQRYHASLSWRLKSSEANGDIEPSCSIWFSIYNDTARVLLNIAYDSYTLSSSDSGWMSLNGTWNATVSAGVIMIHVECSASDYEYYPEVEIANVELALQTVNCIAPSSSAVVASSTPLVKSSTASSSPVSTPVIRSTSVPSSTPAIRSTPVTRSTSIIRSTPLVRSTSASHLSSHHISSTPVSKYSSTVAVVPESTPLSSSVSSVSLIRSTSSRSSSPPAKVSTPLSFTRSRATGSSSIPIPTTLAPSNPPSTQTTDSLPSSSTSLEPSGKASQTSPSVSETEHTSVIASSVTSNSQIVSSSTPLETASTFSAASLPNKSASTLSQTVPATQTQPQLTTSTVFSTSTRTVTACPSTITNCPATAKTTYVTTETIVVSTTVCPVTETKEPHQTTTPQGGNGDYTSTILTTREITITSCAATVTDCPARSQTTLISTQTLVAGTTIIPAGSLETASQTEKGGATGSANPVPVQSGTTASAASGESSTATLPIIPSADATGVLASTGSSPDNSGVQSSTSSTESVHATSRPEEQLYTTSVATTVAVAEASASQTTGVLTLNGANPAVTLSGAASSSETLSSSAALNAGGSEGFAVESKTTLGPVVTSTNPKPSASSSAPLISTGVGSHSTLVTAALSSTHKATAASPGASVYSGAASVWTVHTGLLSFITVTLAALLL
ncbi:hypothetical protein N7466_006324 [Penicillium verhagenii]|uniref:uncharacterized protein n=1 Tax=Penicillium verhagenii TaxID=1562060 RepID=UPI0025454A95|nr:uncharacterized protein N7466_006324 [Penicillium verhagenii]KAJ5930831.1 hypothetical protein N7466_006324 [Penicillium verhagenii]